MEADLILKGALIILMGNQEFLKEAWMFPKDGARASVPLNSGSFKFY